MPWIKSTEKLLDLLKRSKLFDGMQLDEAVAVIRTASGGSLPEDPNAAAQYLVEHNMITRWQADKLLEGRFKGFCWDNYVFLERDAVHETYSTFIAQDTHTGRRVLLAVTPPEYTKKRGGEYKVIMALDD